MAIRVIAGSAKGRTLKMVPGETTRPITDRAKESLFNIIGRRIMGAHFLDLFSGTGSVAIEALSRGAEHAVLVELNKLAAKTIRENLALTRLDSQADVLQINVFALLKQHPGETFDYIYIAPPQYKGLWLETLEALDNNPAWLPSGTIVIVQIDPREREDVALSHLTPIDERRYGNTLLWFFKAEEQ